MLASAGAFGYRWSGLRRGVRARVPPDPRDRPELRQTEPVGVPLCHGSCSLSSRSSPRGLRLDQPLRQKTCRHCSRLFAIWAACDRGHVYCTPRCRAAGRRRSVQAARARHQHSPEGRLDHRDRQRAYRDRRRVTDQSSTAPRRSTRLAVLDVAAVRPPAPTRCVVCGRTSGWLIPMREPRVDRRRRDDDHARAAR